MLILNVPPPYGGGEIRAKQLSNYFSNKPDFVIIENSNKSKNKSNQGKILLSNLIINVNYIIKNLKIIIKEKPSVVYMSIPKKIIPLFKIIPVLILTRIFGGKVIGELAGRNFYFLETHGLSYWFGLKILKVFNSIRVLGESVNDTLKTHGLTSNIVIDNGVNILNQKYNTVKSIKHTPVTIGFVGALHEKKGIYILLEIAKLLKDSNVNFTLEIAGEWENSEDKVKAENYVKQHKLTNEIKFLGLIHNEEKWKFYKKIDVFVLPSYNEGQPLVLIEAMGFGIPIVCSGVGAIQDTVISGFNGFIIQDFRSNKYVEEIKKLLRDTCLYKEISLNNLETFERRFKVDDYFKNIHQWIHIISEK